MKTINIHEAKTHLSRLVEEAVQGDPFIIAKAGKPLVRVTRLDGADLAAREKQGKRQLGQLQGLYTIPDDFDTMFAKEIEEMFCGEE